jgi:hypothetical protein
MSKQTINVNGDEFYFVDEKLSGGKISVYVRCFDDEHIGEKISVTFQCVNGVLNDSKNYPSIKFDNGIFVNACNGIINKIDASSVGTTWELNPSFRQSSLNEPDRKISFSSGKETLSWSIGGRKYKVSPTLSGVEGFVADIIKFAESSLVKDNLLPVDVFVLDLLKQVQNKIESALKEINKDKVDKKPKNKVLSALYSLGFLFILCLISFCVGKCSGCNHSTRTSTHTSILPSTRPSNSSYTNKSFHIEFVESKRILVTNLSCNGSPSYLTFYQKDGTPVKLYLGYGLNIGESENCYAPDHFVASKGIDMSRSFIVE